MTTYFVSRHLGSKEWAASQGIVVDRLVEHLDVAVIQRGDVVLGTLPVHLAAEVCARGARYLHLSIDVPAEYRGKELSCHDMQRFGARIEEFCVQKVHATPKTEEIGKQNGAQDAR